MAASGLKAPGYLDLNGNLSQNFTDTQKLQKLQKLPDYAIASCVSEKSEKIQCNVFLHVVGLQPKKYSVYGLFDMMKKVRWSP